MGNRGQKRMEVVDEELPADKRACCKSQASTSSGSSSVQAQANETTPVQENVDVDMDISSNPLEQEQEEEEQHNDSDYDSNYPEENSDDGSDDGSDDDAEPELQPEHRQLQEFQWERAPDDKQKLTSMLSSLTEETDASRQLIILMALCEHLSFCTEDSLTVQLANSLSPLLVKLANHESIGEIMLLSIRAITYLCDVYPPSLPYLIHFQAIPALCQRLLTMEYQDVAEQCLQALEKISKAHPVECLNAGTIMAVLSYIDFFSTSSQRVAISTVVNICMKLRPVPTAAFMDAVPVLCNLLQYEDGQLVENVAICLTKITDQVSQLPVMLDQLCNHGLINQSTHLLNLNSRTTLSQPVYNGVIRMLRKLSSGSSLAFRTLYELNIGYILKDIISTYDSSHSVSSTDPINASSNLMHEVLKLVIELLPASPVNQLALEKGSFLVNQPNLLQQFEVDMLPVMIQLLISGATVYVSYGCLSAIHKLTRLSNSDNIVGLLKNSNISSVLSGILSRNERHVVFEALQIVEVLLEKYRDAFLNSFIKEGVLFAIEGILSSAAKDQQQNPVSGFVQVPAEVSQKPGSKEVAKCLCQYFERSTSETCKIGNVSVSTLARRIKESYFGSEVLDSEKGLTEVLQNLKNLSEALGGLITVPIQAHDENFISIWKQIMERLNGNESVSTFEFTESGVVKSLANYLSNGLYYHKGDPECDSLPFVGRRFEMFARLLWSNGEVNPSMLVQKLQNSLSSLENFLIIPNQFSKQKKSVATIPNGQPRSYPCLQIRFVKAEGETTLSDYSQDLVAVDPLCSFDDVSQYMWPKVADSSSNMEIDGHDAPEALCRLMFRLQGRELDSSLSVYQAMLLHKLNSVNETGSKLSGGHSITYERAPQLVDSDEDVYDDGSHPFLSYLVANKIASRLKGTSPIAYDMLFLLKSLEGMNRYLFHLMCLERINAFGGGKLESLDDLRVQVYHVPRSEFVSSKLTEKLEQQLRDSFAMSTFGLPPWFNDLMDSCPFLFSFEAKSKYFRLAAFGSKEAHHNPQHRSSQNGHSEGRAVSGSVSLPRTKFLACREKILDSAAKMMELYGSQKVVVEIEYSNEVGTGLGPTLEFYTLVSRAFQSPDLGMWRCEHSEDQGVFVSPSGLFPRPLSGKAKSTALRGVLQKFTLLGTIVAKALQDGRVLDLPFSKAFYKLILGQELSCFDIHLVDPELCKTMVEFQALVRRKKVSPEVKRSSKVKKCDLSFHGTQIKDLCLAFAVPGYTDYSLAPRSRNKKVNLKNLEEYVKAVVNATVGKGIEKQVEAFKSGFNKVFPIEHLGIFNEEELETLLCGERDLFSMNEVLDYIKFDHGYTSSSPPVVNLLEILHEFDKEQQRAFLQFVTGCPRLPPGGLASLNPKLTIVRKHGSDDLPSVMTCANYLKLPPYSSKEMMKEKLIYAITEGQGSFHLS